MTIAGRTGGSTLTPTLWQIHRGPSPIVGTAIHDGHDVEPLVQPCMALDEAARHREEDPFTGELIAQMPNRIVCGTSRFCIDLNRPLAQAVYRRPEDAWNLKVWKRDLNPDELKHLQLLHDDYYAVLHATLQGLERRFGRFVVIDVHSYNHRRDGAAARPTPQDQAPDINIGTFSMDRRRWADVVETFMAHCAAHSLSGRRLDVRENVAFEGRGEQTRFIHAHFPDTGCAIAVEFKKIFMDEWTGAPDHATIRELQTLLATAVPVLEQALGRMS